MYERNIVVFKIQDIAQALSEYYNKIENVNYKFSPRITINCNDNTVEMDIIYDEGMSEINTEQSNQ